MTKTVPWQLFVIQSKIRPEHVRLFDGLASWLSAFDVQVREFQGANSGTPLDLRASNSALIAFDLHPNELSSETLEEIDELKELKDRFWENQGAAGLGFGLAQFGARGHLLETYPQLISSTLDLGKTVADFPDVGQDEIDALLSLFAFRTLVRTCLYRQVMKSPQEHLAVLGSFQALWEKSFEIILAYPADLRHPYHPEIRMLIEELVVWARDLVSAVGFPAFQREAPKFVEWMIEDVERDQTYQNLSEDGLIATIDFLQAIRPPALEALLTICLEPYYTQEPDVKASSNSILEQVLSALDVVTHNDSLVYLQQALERAPRQRQRIKIIRAIGVWAGNQDPDRKREALRIIKSTVMSPECDRSLKFACISAIRDGRLYGMVRWLLKGYENATDEELRAECLVSLVVLLGKSAAPLVMGFIQDASAEARQYVASVAWRIDQDELYDALLQLEPDNSELFIIVILSLTRAHNPRANRLAIAGLASQKYRLQEGAAVLAGDCFDYCQPSQEEREKLIQGLEALSHAEDEALRRYAIASLLRSGDESFGGRGVEVINELILQGEVSLARVLIYNGGTHLPGWPERSPCIDWLQNVSPQIRHMSAYILGHQRRAEFLDQLTWLQSDICVVPRLFGNPQSHQIMGKTVAQAATLAIRRIHGEIPLQLVPWALKG
ncbi:MAG: hypothetical protein PVG14_19680 [Anaerolineales bacterium]|jgi:hypothetical protein